MTDLNITDDINGFTQEMSNLVLNVEFISWLRILERYMSYLTYLIINQIDCKAGTTAEGQNLLANISTNRAS